MSLNDVRSQKFELRSLLKKKLRSMTHEQSKEKGEKLLSHLHQYLYDHNKFDVGCFAPIQEEPFFFLKEDLFRLSFPRLDDKGERMFFSASSYTELVQEKIAGISFLMPRRDALEVVPQVLLIPGLAFDQEGNRLGRGKGHYDRYLSTFEGERIGICFQCQILEAETIPLETLDQKVHLLITEEGVQRPKP